ncbi:MAG: ABC transporter permease [Candidatus Aminicenantes bacterium]|nr:ABC transporter permease [Candidatus Aminicenantes bacterium]
MFRTVRHIIRKEFIQTFRDRRMLFPIFVAPIVQLTLFGYAVTTDIKHISLAVLDHDRTYESRHLISSFSQSESFNLDFYLKSPQEMDRLLETEKIKAAVVIPRKFERNLKKGTQASLQVILDGTDANSATIIMSYISQLIAKHSENILTKFRDRRGVGIVISQPRIWYNPNLKSSVYMVPGVICLILLITTLLLTSMAITKEREMGTLEQLIVSPIKPWELIIGKTMPFVLIGLCDVVVIVSAGKLIFDVPVKGNLLFLLGIALLFVLTTLSLGLFISTISRTQQQAMMTAFFFAMPAMLLSGIFFPIENMPRIIQYITLLNPLRYFSTAVRGILLKGNDITILWPQVLALFFIGITASVLSSLRFKKYLE